MYTYNGLYGLYNKSGGFIKSKKKKKNKEKKRGKD